MAVRMSRSRGVLLLLILLLPSTFVAASLSLTQQRRKLRAPASFKSAGTSSSSSSSSSSSALFARGGAKTLPPPPPLRIATDSVSSSSTTITTATTTTPTNNNNNNKNDNVIPKGDASIPNEVFNVIKSIVGAGVLGLPAGIAAFGNAPTAVVPAMILLVAIGTLSATGFSFIGMVCAKTKSVSYRQAWSRSVGESTAWIPATACLLVTCCSVLTYSMILADTVPSVLRTVTGNALTVSRTTALFSVTALILTPLCLLKDLKSLAPFSLVGILGMLYTATAMTIRYLTGSYTYNTVNANLLLDNLAPQLSPSFGSKGYQSVFSSNSAILVSMLSTAYMAHYNAPKFYWELRHASVERYNRVVAYSFTGAIFLMAATAATGFLTFGGACQSLILNNYAATDKLMSLSRTAVTVSLICSYPLAFGGVRNGLLDLCKVPVDQRNDGFWSLPLTLGLLTLITTGAFFLQDIGIILALGGATWGNFVIYIAPAIMVVHAARQKSKDTSSRIDHDDIDIDVDVDIDLRPMVPRAVALGVIGMGLGAIGMTRILQTL